MAVSLRPSCKVPLLACPPSNICSLSCYPRSLDFSRHQQPQLRLAINGKFKLKEGPLFSRPVCSYHLKPVFALDKDSPHPSDEEPVNLKRGESFEQWDSLTGKFAGAANLPFLLLQLPQIILNSRNLMGGNKSALLAVPWLGMLTGLLGNLSLLSYFIKKRETGAVVVQALGVISIYVVILQLALAEAMPVSYFIGISTVVASGLILNFMKYFDLLESEIWLFWEEFITIGGLSVLPQVMWSTFIPYVPNSILPGMISFVAAMLVVLMARMGKLPEKGVKILGSISGWTATLLFMWMPVAQMWTNILNPDNIKGLSAITMLLAMIGNGLLLPRALFIRDLMCKGTRNPAVDLIRWISSSSTVKGYLHFKTGIVGVGAKAQRFTGSAWGCVFYGWGNLLCLYCLNSASREFFLAATLAFLAWIGHTFWKDSQVYGLRSPFSSFKELVFGP